MLNDTELRSQQELDLESEISKKAWDGHFSSLGVLLIIRLVAYDLGSLPDNWQQDIIELIGVGADFAGILGVIVFTKEGLKAYFKAFELLIELNELPERRVRKAKQNYYDNL